MVGCTEDKYKELEASKDLMAELLDLKEPDNEVHHMNQFVPFTMKVTSEGTSITMMEIPPQPNNPNVTPPRHVTQTNAATGNNNPVPHTQEQNNDENVTNDYDD